MTTEERREYNARYYREHRERLQGYQRAYYQANKERCNRRSYATKNRNIERYAEAQAWIAPAMKEAGISNRRMAEMLGVSKGAVGAYKSGRLKAPSARIREILRLEERVLEILGLGGAYAENTV